MGVGALGAGIVTCASKTYPEIEVRILDYGRDSIKKRYIIEGRTKDAQLLNMRFSKKLYLPNNIALLLAVAAFVRLLPSREWRASLYKHNKYLRSVQEADIIGAISGGDSFSDIYGMERFYYVIFPKLLVLLMQKDLVLLPQTIGPFEGHAAGSLARWIMKKACLVYSRDKKGVEETKALLGQSTDFQKIRFSYDMGFAVEPVQPAQINIIGLDGSVNKQSMVGLNISGLLYMGGYTRDNMFGLKINYREFVDALISHLIDKMGGTVLLIPHVFGSGEDSESDESACRKVYDELCDKYPGRLGYLRGGYDQSEVKYVIGKCDFFIGSRMHACIAAISQKVPTVSIAYSNKFKGVMDTVGMGEYVADPRSMTEKEIIEMIGHAYAERNIIREKLAEKMPEVTKSVMGLFKEIWDELRNARTAKVTC